MSDISAWLESLSLSKYQAVFVENEIDFEILPELNEQDLEKLDIPLGPRKKLLKAIAALSTAGANSAERDTPSAMSQPERRQLTVMFVDLVGSTALSGQFDPEDMRELILAYQNAVAGEISRFEGHVAKFMGDGVLAYFGWPRTHEDEAERAVRAALAVTAAVAKLSAPDGRALAARVGIATGLVVVGDLIGKGSAQEEAVVGETPNLAARLQTLAASGQIVIAEATRRLLGAVFELEDLGQRELKGLTLPVRIFAVTGERAPASRFEARSSGNLLPMVGRDQEFALLLARWALARAGEGQAILLVGEAGIGKSRITQALLDAVAKEPHIRIRYQCSPYHSDSALWPVIQQLIRAAGLSAGDSLDARLDKLETLLGQAGTVESVPLIAALLGIDGESRYGRLDLSPQQQRIRTLRALIEQLTRLAQQRPVLWVLEDAHWIDPTTLELIELALDAVSQAPVLLLLTARPDFEHTFGGHPLVTRLTLNRLGREPVLAVVHSLTGGKTLPDELLNEIIGKTDGVPLFVEELTKTVLESGMLRATEQRYELTGPLRSVDIPNSLQDSLMARLDRQPQIRNVAQTAACIGREFSYPLLAAVAAIDEGILQSALDQLVEVELIFRRGLAPEATYTFKHALVRDAAYESLLKSKRQQRHAQVARVLQERFTERVASAPELLAQHYAGAGLVEQALDYWQRAGEQAIGRSANTEAIAHLNNGLELLRSLPENSKRDRQELALQRMRAVALSSARGQAAEETEAAYRTARALCQKLSNPPDIFAVLRGLHSVHTLRAEHAAAYAIARDFLTLVEKNPDAAARAFAHVYMGVSLWARGEFSKACQHLEQALGLYDLERDSNSALIYGHDAKAAALQHLSPLLCLSGYPDRALAIAQEGIRHSEALGFAFPLAWNLSFATRTMALRREYQAIREPAKRLATFALNHGLPLARNFANMHLGRADVGLGHVDQGKTQIQAALKNNRAMRTELLRAEHLAEIAQALVAADQIEEATEILDEACEWTERSGERFVEAELHRIRGELLLSGNRLRNADRAEACFFKSLDIARRQQARWWELRTATNLARLWRDQGKYREAYKLLAPIYGWFTEGFDTADLKDAKALLDELSKRTDPI